VFRIVINEAEHRMALPRQYPDKLIMVTAVRGVSFLVKLYVWNSALTKVLKK